MPVTVRVALHPSLLPDDLAWPTTAVAVIDTLRFTTTACQALRQGATWLSVAEHIDDARRQQADSWPDALLCGERHCHPIDGFDLGNSPAEYVPDKVQGQCLICTTTNGTHAVAAARRAGRVMLASLVNRHAVQLALADPSLANWDTWIVCAGTDGEVAMEDVLTAGAILDGPNCLPAGDGAHIALAVWQRCGEPLETSPNAERASLERTLSLAAGGRNLVEAGYEDDLVFAASLDSLPVVPVNTAADWRRFQRLA